MPNAYGTYTRITGMFRTYTYFATWEHSGAVIVWAARVMSGSAEKGVTSGKIGTTGNGDVQNEVHAAVCAAIEDLHELRE